jgi:hypothetical protein
MFSRFDPNLVLNDSFSEQAKDKSRKHADCYRIWLQIFSWLVKITTNYFLKKNRTLELYLFWRGVGSSTRDGRSPGSDVRADEQLCHPGRQGYSTKQVGVACMKWAWAGHWSARRVSICLLGGHWSLSSGQQSPWGHVQGWGLTCRPAIGRPGSHDSQTDTPRRVRLRAFSGTPLAR